jgi:3-hydroxyisobutyrate dehydrogenase
MRVGFIGLGNMGAPMAGHLVAAGHEVAGFDLNGHVPEGVDPAPDAAGAAKGRDVVVTMLTSGSVVRTVYAMTVPAASPGTLFLDCSTIDVTSARTAAGLAAEAGLAAVDAPVIGGVDGAAAGTLTFTVGGTPEGCERVRPLLETMGSRVVYCGGAGSGQAAKACNNLILGATMIAACEAFALAHKLGLDPHALYDVVSSSTGACWSVTSCCPVPGVGPASPADHDYAPGFLAELMLKDLDLAQEAAATVNAATPIGGHAAALYAAFVATGGRGRDFSAMYPWIRDHGHAF